MKYPIVFEINYSKKYLHFFYAINLLTIAIIWYFYSQFLISLLLTFVVILYLYLIRKNIIKKIDTIVINKDNILINNQKINSISVQFSNNLWTVVKYNYYQKKSIHLMIFNDSCKKHSIFVINKYLNFEI